MKIKLTKDNKIIVEDVRTDMENRNEASVAKLLAFYFKILTEPTIRTKSYRYIHAEIAFTTICNDTNDIETLNKFKAYHASKLSFEKSNPVRGRAQARSTTNTATKAVSTKVNKQVNVSMGLGGI